VSNGSAVVEAPAEPETPEQPPAPEDAEPQNLRGNRERGPN
jgi:hypothetical protein